MYGLPGYEVVELTEEELAIELAKIEESKEDE